jgi:hypothetical protein
LLSLLLTWAAAAFVVFFVQVRLGRQGQCVVDRERRFLQRSNTVMAGLSSALNQVRKDEEPRQFDLLNKFNANDVLHQSALFHLNRISLLLRIPAWAFRIISS